MTLHFEIVDTYHFSEVDLVLIVQFHCDNLTVILLHFASTKFLKVSEILDAKYKRHTRI